MFNNYHVLSDNRTSGLQEIGSDINAYNFYGMTPLQVALEAGVIDEVQTILSDPQCDPLKKSRAGRSSESFIDAYESKNRWESKEARETVKMTAEALRLLLQSAVQAQQGAEFTASAIATNNIAQQRLRQTLRVQRLSTSGFRGPRIVDSAPYTTTQSSRLDH